MLAAELAPHGVRSKAIGWLASDEARSLTGVALPVDGGITAPFELSHSAG